MIADFKDFWETIYRFQYSVATRVPAWESMKSLYFCKALIWKLEKIYQFLRFHLDHLIGVSWTSFNAPRVVRRNGCKTSKRCYIIRNSRNGWVLWIPWDNYCCFTLDCLSTHLPSCLSVCTCFYPRELLSFFRFSFSHAGRKP